MTHITIKREVLEQAIEAAESNFEYTEAEYLERREFWGEKLDYRWKNLEAAAKQARDTLTALRTAMEAKDVEPAAWLITSPGFNLAQVHKPTALLSNEVAVPLFAYHLPPTLTTLEVVE